MEKGSWGRKKHVAPGLLRHQVCGLPEHQALHHTPFTGCPTQTSPALSVLMSLYFLLGCQPHPCPASHYFLPESQLLQ